jgi:magnesium chelatase family protein
VLFIDGAGELSGPVREALRTALDERRIRVTGGAASAEYPAGIQLVLATTGCPQAGTSVCDCAPEVHRRYLGRLAGLLDRVDIQATLTPMPLQADGPGESTAVVAARVAQARVVAAARWSQHPWHTNGEAAGDALRRSLARVPAQRLGPLKDRLAAGSLSARGGVSVLRLAWSFPDLASHRRPTAADVAEAIWLRTGQEVYP